MASTITFLDLHHIIQIAMGWKNSHLFEFKVGDYIIGFDDNDAPENVADASKVMCDTLFTKTGEKFSYLYDFGDGWDHTVEVEQLLEKTEGQQYPACIEGEMNCPPEDCGGIPGFQYILKVLKDKHDPEYKDMRTWAGRYNSQKFNREKINRELPKFRE